MAATLHGRRAVLPRHRALLHRSHQHFGRDNSARTPIRLRLRRARTRALRRVLGILVDAARRRMDGGSIRRSSRAGRRRRHLVARNFRHANRCRRIVLRAARRTRSARPRRGRQLPVDSQPDQSLDAAVGARARFVRELQRHVRRNHPGAERESADHQGLRMARAVLHFGRARFAVGRRMVVHRRRPPRDFVARDHARTRVDHVDAHRRAARHASTVGGNRTRAGRLGNRRRAFLQQLRIQHPAALDAHLSASHLQRAARARRRLFDHSMDRDVLRNKFLGLAGRHSDRARPLRRHGAQVDADRGLRARRNLSDDGARRSFSGDRSRTADARGLVQRHRLRGVRRQSSRRRARPTPAS